MLLKKFSNSDSESFSFIASCLLGFHLFIFIFYSFICSFIHSFIHLYLFIYLFSIYLFSIYLFCLLSPQATSTPLCGLLGDLRDFKASSGTVMLLFCFLSTEIFWIRGFLNVEIVEVVSPQQRHEPLCVSDTVTSSVGIMNKQFQSKYPGRVFVSPWVDKRNVLLEHHARGFCCNFLHIVVTSALSWKPYSFILQLSAVPRTGHDHATSRKEANLHIFL